MPVLFFWEPGPSVQGSPGSRVVSGVDMDEGLLKLGIGAVIAIQILREVFSFLRFSQTKQLETVRYQWMTAHWEKLARLIAVVESHYRRKDGD